MLEKAIEKIKLEMYQNKSNSYIQVVGEFLMQHIQANPGAAEKILAEGKTIGKSFDEMRKVAEKRQVNRCGMLAPQEGIEFVLNYFGISDKPAKVEAPRIIIEEVKPVAKRTEFSVNLDDLL